MVDRLRLRHAAWPQPDGQNRSAMKPARALWLLAYLLLLPAPAQADADHEVTIKADTLTLDQPSAQEQAAATAALKTGGGGTELRGLDQASCGCAIL